MNIKTTKWMTRFIDVATVISSWSKDESTKVGAVIVDKCGEPISWGFNGFPMGVDDSIKERNERPLKYQYTQHAERNAMDFAPRSNLETCTLIVTHFPCCECAKSIIQRKIKTVITNNIDITTDFYSRWKNDIEITTSMFNEAGVEIIFLGKENNE